MTTDLGRSNRIGKNFDVLLWVQARRAPFTRHEMARELEISHRSALRYLHCLETRDVVRSDRPGEVRLPWRWVSTTTRDTCRTPLN